MILSMTSIRWPLSFSVFVLFLLNNATTTLASTGSDGPPPLTPFASGPTNIHLEDADPPKKHSVMNTTTVAAVDQTRTPESCGGNLPLWKQRLPFPLNNKTKTLQRILIPDDACPMGDGDALDRIGSHVEVFILGTAHISKDSSRDVRQLLESVEPDAIFLELCHQRMDLLDTSGNCSEDIGSDCHHEQSTEVDEVTLNQSNNTTGGVWNPFRGLFRRGSNARKQKKIDTRSLSSVASSLLSNMQVDYADSLGVELGGEFRAAYRYWKQVVPKGGSSFRKVNRINYVHMILGDRPVTLTLTRAWESLRIWGKVKLMIGLLVSSLRKPNPDELREWMEKILYGDTDLMSESVTELAKHFPTLAEVILKERDAYMACKLQQTCRGLLNAGNRERSIRRYRLVAIVGAGHVEGICKWLTKGGSLAEISTVATTVAASPLPISSTTTSTSDGLQPRQETPEDILSKLIEIKGTIPKEDHDYLVNRITELDPELIQEISG